jgi:5-methylcytosine-specific restriction endonuclease McrA
MKPWAERFYNSNSWRQCRHAYIKSKHGLCERCLKRGDINPAKIAHHKIHLTDSNINNPNISLSWNNLEALCQDCHNKEHHENETEARYAFDREGNIIPPISERI